MNIQAFVPDWPGTKQHAKETASLLAPYCQSVTILSDPDDYFTEQWEKARAAFSGDVLLWVMADVWPPENLAGMFKAIQVFLAQGSNVGIYAPDVDWTGHELFPEKLTQIAEGVYEVPMPEMLCWAIRREVLSVMPNVDPRVNRLGWGIDYLATAAAEKIGMFAVRDYNLCASHPNSTSYGNNNAAIQFENWKQTLNQDWLARVDKLFAERQRVGVRLRNLILHDEIHDAQGLMLELKLKALGTDKVRTALVPTTEDGLLEVFRNINDVYILTKDYPFRLIWEAINTGYVDNIFIPIEQARKGNYPFGDIETYGFEWGLMSARDIKVLDKSK